MHDSKSAARTISRRGLVEKRRLRPARVARALFAVSFVAFLPKPTSAQDRYSQAEVRALPRVCLAQKFVIAWLDAPVVPEQEQREWEAKLGPGDYRHFHHYCAGLIYLRRAADADKGGRNFNYRNAVSNFQYVLNNSSREFPLLPEVYLRKGMALQLMGEHVNAASEFLGAIKVKPDYTPAYSALVDLHLYLGDIESARAILETGLEHAPDSKILTTQKAKLEQEHNDGRQ